MDGYRMSWLRIEGKMPGHRKVAPLSDAAFRLHVTASAWCAEHRTDGRVPLDIPATLTRAPQGKALKSCVDDLLARVLWHKLEDCYQIHDYLEWNWSASDYERRASSGQAGGRAKASKRLASATASATADATADAKPMLDLCSSKTLPVSVSVSVSDLKIPPVSPPPGGKTKRIVPKASRTHAPDTLEPSEATLETALKTGQNVASEWIACRDWAWSKGEMKADWQATLRGWMRRTAEKPANSGVRPWVNERPGSNRALGRPELPEFEPSPEERARRRKLVEDGKKRVEMLEGRTNGTVG